MEDLKMTYSFRQREQKIGFDKIRNWIANRCQTRYAADRVAAEEVSTHEATIRERLELTDEMRVILLFESSFPDSGYIDCLNFLIPLQTPATCIDLESLNQLKEVLNTLRRLTSFFDRANETQYPRLKALSKGVDAFPEILLQIDRIVDRFGEVRDNASPELLQIRRSLREKEGAISRRIQNILRSAQESGIVDSDVSVAVREGRVLIPIPAGNKRKIPGYVIDESATGKTAFIEPMEIVELNNQVKELHFAEQREIHRILLAFSDFIRPDLPMLIASAEYIGEIDFIRAKGSVANFLQAGKPILSQQGELKLQRARHPILEQTLKKEGKEVVPLDLQLDPQKHILLISGPNAGGKSVCLKTVGLLQYMLQWGFAVTASETSEFPIFDHIFIDIGDNQSIENDLSTYSSHLTQMKAVLEMANEHSLVLIDEFGSGTEPAAGGAIAEEILSTLEERGTYGVITTHYTNLKLYAGNSNGVINGAMQFDTQKIVPLFRLEIGLPGNSFAFELARKIGLPEMIVHGAEERAGNEFVNIERNLRRIARSKRQLEEKLVRIRHTDKTLESITDKYQKELDEIQRLRKDILNQAREEAKQLLEDANRKIEGTIREIKEAQAEKEQTRQARRELNQFTETLQTPSSTDADLMIQRKIEKIMAQRERKAQRKAEREKQQSQQAGQAPAILPEEKVLQVGSKVRILGAGLIGEVVQISGKQISINVGQLTTRTQRDKVELISANEYRQTIRTVAPPKSTYNTTSLSERRLNFSPNIDIRGQRLDEAIPTVTHFIDDAIMVGVSEVRILHGKGNGILKEEIRKYLKITPGVRSFADEHIEHGGSGITVVRLD